MKGGKKKNFCENNQNIRRVGESFKKFKIPREAQAPLPFPLKPTGKGFKHAFVSPPKEREGSAKV